MLYLNKGVYLVDGKCNSTLYDSGTEKLYVINKELRNLLCKAMGSDYSFGQEEGRHIDSLVDAGLLTHDVVHEHDVFELKTKPNFVLAWIEVTTGCNLKCIHCYENAGSGQRSDMEFEDYCYAIDKLVDAGIKRIQLIGGEPLILGEKLKAFIDYASGKFDFFEIFTNGTLMNDSIIDYIKDKNICIAFSVYSYNGIQHDKVTQVDGSWAKTNSAIKKVKDAGVKYRVANTLIKGIEIGERNTELYKLSKERDVVRLSGRANINLVSEDNLRKRLLTKRSFSRPIKKEFITKLISGHNCFSTHLFIATGLDVYPCVMERRFCQGNLRNMSIGSMLSSEIAALSKDDIDECKDCEYRYYCFDCRPDSMGRDKFAKPWYCTYNPLTGEWNDPEEYISSIIKTDSQEQ